MKRKLLGILGMFWHPVETCQEFKSQLKEALVESKLQASIDEDK